MPIVKRYLIVRANGDVRAQKTTQRIAADEVAIPIDIDIPKAWGNVDRDQTITIKVPQPPTAQQNGAPKIGEREVTR